MPMIVLAPGMVGGLRIAPRWPSSRVRIDPLALERLQSIQAELPANTRLILTRAYEPRTSGLGWLRNGSRRLGVALFRLLYSRRHDEIDDIFGANGHDCDGTHLDIALAVDGRRIRLLPLSVFTPLSWQRRRVERVARSVRAVETALIRAGFSIHRNETERHQIHCDLLPATVFPTEGHHAHRSPACASRDQAGHAPASASSPMPKEVLHG